MDITIKCDQTFGAFTHFWQSTGFTPASLLLTPDMRQTLTYVGAVPHGGIVFIRIHFLLDLVAVQGMETESLAYDWSKLDEGLDLMQRNGLKPFFELMGNPSGFFSDFHDDAQLHAWKHLVRDLALHLMDRYGRDEVESWYFETWNEPDTGWWDQFPKDVTAFCKYYDACSEGLKEANPQLRFGGPGTCSGLTDWLKAFLAHCDTGENYFTGEKGGVRLDFISVHEKGVTWSKEDLTPDSMGIVEREAAIIQHIRDTHPVLVEVPFMNNECDPQIGWKDFHTWRARPYYAAFIAKVINQHLVRLIDDMKSNYVLLSNDNGFIGSWGNRTHLTQFGKQEQVERGEFVLIKKPALNVMTMLSLLGDTRCAVVGTGDVSTDVGAIATRRGDAQVAILLYNSRDKIMSSGVERVRLHIEGLPFTEGMRVHYRIGEYRGDPFANWEQMGAPVRPTAEQFAEMRAHQELAMLNEPTEVQAGDGRVILDFDLPLPSVSLVLLSARPAEVPGKPGGLRAEMYPGLCEGYEEVMLRWDGVPSRCIRSYEVLYAPTADGPFERVNGADLLDHAYLHVRAKGGEAGYYRVRAVDYWGRAGETSETLAL